MAVSASSHPPPPALERSTRATRSGWWTRPRAASVAGRGLGGDAEPRARRRRQGVGEPAGVEPPAGGDRGCVDGEHPRPVGVVRAAQVGRRDAREVVERPHQEVEALVHLEAGLQEGHLVGSREGAGEHAGVPARRQLLDGAVHGVHRRSAATRHDVRGSCVAPPGHDPEPGVRARQEAVPSHRRNGTGGT